MATTAVHRHGGEACADQDGIEHAEESAEALWGNTSATEVAPGGVVPLGAWAHLELDEESWMSQFRIRSGSAGAYAVFADHPPTEFENGFRYFKDKQGNDIEPAAEKAGDHKDDPGATTMASTDDQAGWARSFSAPRSSPCPRWCS
jgi:hypothetical protein